MTELTSAELDQYLIQLARDDLGAFMGTVHETDMPGLWGGKALPAAHHERMIEVLTDDSLGHSLILMPRGAGKTYLLQGWIEWLLGRASLGLDGFGKNWAQDFRVVYISNTAHQAYRLSNAVKATIESNRLYQAIFPKVKPHKDKWSQEDWKVAGNHSKDSNLVATGRGGPLLGARALKVVLDDPADAEYASSVAIREDCVGVRSGNGFDGSGWLDTTVDKIMVPWGRQVMTATRWHWDDPPAWAEASGWFKLEQQAIVQDEDGVEHSYWEERFPLVQLQESRKRKPKAFASQMQNTVAPDEGDTFLREWFPEFDRIPEEIAFTLCSWDTAFGTGKNRSYSAGWSAAVTPDLHVYLFGLGRGQWPYPVLRENVLRQADDTGARFVIIEKRQSGQALTQELAVWRPGWQLIEWDPSTVAPRTTRLDLNRRATTFLAQRRVHLPSEYYARQHGCDWLHDAKMELFAYPHGREDDVVDALCQMVFWLIPQLAALTGRVFESRPMLRYEAESVRRIAV